MLARILGRPKFLVGLAATALLTVGLVGGLGTAGAPPAAAAGTAAATARTNWLPTPPVPPAIQVPAGNELTALLAGSGVQIYQCTAGAWSFLEPAAQLVGWDGLAAIHYRGPTWESTRDGSLVQAKAVGSAPVPGSIPQLLLQATLTRGNGIFGSVTYIQRLATNGGAAPTTACTDGQTQAVPYTALYLFYVQS